MCRSCGGNDRGAIAKFPRPVVRRGDIEPLVQGRRCAQRYFRAAGNVAGQPAADISAVPGVRRTTVALVDDNRRHRSIPLSVAAASAPLAYLEDDSSLDRPIGYGAHRLL